MRLLQLLPNGEVSLTTNFPNDSIPPYAILSHRWEQNNEEVTFKDINDGKGQKKTGFDKIKFCGHQAINHGLRYFWIDSCCIDKSAAGEHQQAIHSMFHWYRRASRCYVYLSDVSISRSDSEAQQLQKFQDSLWFTRGWTLQELLAPPSVEFYSQNHVYLGDKRSLADHLHRITGIHLRALQGERLSKFTDKERFDWIERRTTTFGEDMAYSMQGIFDVYIPIRYGEGKINAFQRLEDQIQKHTRCLRDLRATNPRDDKKRIEETKGGLLENAYSWILRHNTWLQWRNTDDHQLLWIKGDSGKGKTMLLCGIIDDLEKDTTRSNLLSFFFCQATDSRINTATAVLRGLLYLLIKQQPSLISHIQKRHDHAGKALFEDTNAWFSLTETFTEILQDSRLEPTYLIIDALDECTKDLDKLLDFIIRSLSLSTRFKWVVSSRNWLSIQERFERTDSAARLSLELNEESIATAVSTYVRFKVDRLALDKKYNPTTRENVLQYLQINAGNTFLWVALVCQNLQDVPQRHVLRELSMFPPGLDSIYKRMLELVIKSRDSSVCKQILACVATVYVPVTLSEVVSLVEGLEDAATDLDTVQEIINECGSFLTIRNDRIFFVHQSAKDYLLDQGSVDIFPTGPGTTHYRLFMKSINLISKLKRDIYKIRAPGRLISEIETPTPDPLAALRYSCGYWVDHACEGMPSLNEKLSELQEGGAVDLFLRFNYLQWLEALSLCKNMSRAVLGMEKLQTLVRKQSASPMLCELVQDAYRFIMYNKPAIETSPLQTYVSALLFSPTDSIIRRSFVVQHPDWVTIKAALPPDWTACLLTLEGHGGSVASVAFSPDGRRAASGSDDETVRLWDAESGTPLSTLEGHGGWVRSVTFSPDGRRVASGSHDRTVRLWDAESGTPLSTLKGHGDSVTSVAFSPDGRRVVSSSYDGTVRLWDAESGTLLLTLKGHRDWVISVAFSPDSRRVVSSSYDRTVRLWDAESGMLLSTLKGHRGSVTSVVFSPDGRRVVSGSHDGTVRLWDTESGMPLSTLEGHGDCVMSVAFSPDGRRVASGSDYGIVRLWDAESGTPLSTLEAGETLYQLSFSADGKQLNTNRGILSLLYSIPVLNELSNTGFFVSDQWIMLDSMRLIWLPSEYRPTEAAGYQQKLALGHRSGLMSFFLFKTSRMNFQ